MPPRQRHRLELLHATRDGDFRWQALDARRSEEADDAFGMVDDVLGIFRFGDRPAVAEHQNIRVDLLGSVVKSLHAINRFFERQRRLGTDASLRRQQTRQRASHHQQVPPEERAWFHAPRHL